MNHTYVDPLDPFLKRQELLTVGQFFSCICQRFSDPTEFGSYSSALKISYCKFPANRKSTEADLNCTNCKKKFPFIKISTLTDAVRNASQKLEHNAENPDVGSIPAHEAFLDKFGKVLHSKHGIIIKVKYNLARMYGNMLGFEGDKLSDIQLKHKKTFCEEVLIILVKIMPTLSSMRGVMLYESHLPCILLGKSYFRTN